MATLIIREGFNEGATFRLGQRTLTMGRDPGNMVQLIDDKVSRRHCMVRWTEFGYLLQDLMSYNGVLLNGERVDEGKIQMGDKITVGKTVLELVDDNVGGQDATLGRKVVEKQIVAESTRGMDLYMGVQKQIESGEIVDVDKEGQTLELKSTFFLMEIDRFRKAEAPPKAWFEKAAKGLGEYLAPDRCLVLTVSKEGKAVPAATDFADGLKDEQKRTGALAAAVQAVFQRKKPFIINRIPEDQPLHGVLGSAMAAPIMHEGGPVVGILYMDSFADNLQAYIEEDLELMMKTADKLKEAFPRPEGAPQAAAPRPRRTPPTERQAAQAPPSASPTERRPAFPDPQRAPQAATQRPHSSTTQRPHQPIMRSQEPQGFFARLWAKLTGK